MANQPISSQFNAPIAVAVLLLDVDTAGGMASIVNNTGVDLIITNCVTNIKTVATGACLMDVGPTAVSATTASDTLMDGIDMNAATGTLGTADQAGANGKLQQRWVAGKWVTASVIGGGASAGLVGSLYLTCIPAPAGG